MLHRQHMPQTPELPNLKIPYVKTEAINPHLKLSTIQNTDYPVVTLSILFEAGDWNATKPGIAYLVAEMLPKTAYTTDKTIEQMLEYYGAQLSCIETKDTLDITLETPTTHFNELLPIFAHMLQHPTFTQKDFRILQPIIAQQLKQENANLQKLASKTLNQQLFKPEHPYGYILDNSVLDSLSIEDIRTHYEKNAWHNTHIYLSGHVTDEMIIKVKKIFSNIHPQARTSIDTTITTLPPSQKNIQRKCAQAIIRMTHPTITPKHPDYIPFYCTNQLLGGFFGSRLMANIREEKGYTYGITTYIQPLRYIGCWILATSVKKEYVKATCEEIKKEIHTLQTTLVHNEELKNLKSYLLGNLLSILDNPFYATTQLKAINLHDRDLSYYTELYHTIKNIEPKTIQAMAQKYLKTEGTHQVIITA